MKKHIASVIHFLIAVFFVVACVDFIINNSATVGVCIVLVVSSLFCLLQLFNFGLALFSTVLSAAYSRRFCHQYELFFEALQETHTLRYRCYFSPDTLEEADVYTKRIEELGAYMLALGNSVIRDGLLHGKRLEEIQTLMENTVKLMNQTQPLNKQCL